MKLEQTQIDAMIANGAVYGPRPVFTLGEVKVADEPKEEKPVVMVESGVSIVHGNLVAFVPVATKSESNLRDWRKRSRRSGEAWRAVSRTLGPCLALLAPFAEAYHSQKALKVTFTRLGGRHLDHMANLGGSMKGVEDALAFMLGASDGDPRWHAIPEQTTGGDVGVMVEIEVML